MRSKFIFVLLIAFIPSVCFGANKTTNDVKITIISSDIGQTHILLQTDPRPDISGLGCTNNYWLMLYNNNGDAAFKTILSMLLTAHATGKNVSVVSDDNNGGEFCKLSRLILK